MFYYDTLARKKKKICPLPRNLNLKITFPFVSKPKLWVNKYKGISYIQPFFCFEENLRYLLSKIINSKLLLQILYKKHCIDSVIVFIS